MAKYEMTRIEMYLAWLSRLLIGPLMLLTNACAGCGGLSLNIVWVYQSQHTGPSLSSPAIRLVESWIYTEFIKKMTGGGENLGLSTRARHFRTDRIFVHRFLLSKRTRNLVLAKRNGRQYHC